MNTPAEEIARLRAQHKRLSGGSLHERAQFLEDASQLLTMVPRLLDEIERLRAGLREAMALLRDVDEFANPVGSWQRCAALLAKHKEDA